CNSIRCLLTEPVVGGDLAAGEDDDAVQKWLRWCAPATFPAGPRQARCRHEARRLGISEAMPQPPCPQRVNCHLHAVAMSPYWFPVNRASHCGAIPLWNVFSYLRSMRYPNGIAEQRERKGLNKSDLARRIGTTRQQMGRLERGERTLTRDWAERIA